MATEGAGRAAPGVVARARPRQAVKLLWASSRSATVALFGWAAATAVVQTGVVLAFGVLAGAVPGATAAGLHSPAGSRLVVAFAVAAGLFVISILLGPYGSQVNSVVRLTMTAGLQRRLLAAVLGPPGVAHLEDPTVLTRISSAAVMVTDSSPADAVVQWASRLSSRATGYAACVVIAVQIWWAGLVLVAAWILARRFIMEAVVDQGTSRRFTAGSRRRAMYLSAVGSRARDAKEVRVFGLGEFISERYRRYLRESFEASIPAIRRVHRRVAAGFVLITGAYVLVAGRLTYLARHAQLPLDRLTVLLPMLALTTLVGVVSFNDVTLTRSLTAVPDLDETEAALVTGARPGPAPGHPALRSAVRFEGVDFRYPSRPADTLHGLDLDLAAGRATALVGVNGAGKTTLVSLLAGLRQPTRGRILVDGVDLRSLDPAQWQRTVALVTQRPIRFAASLYDNIALGSVEHRDDRDGVRSVAERMDLLGLVDTLPAGWATVLAPELPGGVELSGGQWQRVALARALFATDHGARLLVLDEPTAAMDIPSEARFLEDFFDLTAGLTTLVISHRFSSVRRAGSIYVIDSGHVVEQGGHDELLALDGRYARMFRLQAEGFR